MVGGRETKGNLRMDEMDTIEEHLELILRMLKWSDPLEEKHTGWKRIDLTISMVNKD